MGGKIVHWDGTEVGLLKRHGPNFNARICTRRTTLLQTRETKNTPGLTIPLDTTRIQKKQLYAII